MKKSLFCFAILCLNISCTAIKGEGEIVTEQRKVATSAWQLSVESAITVTLSDQVQPGELEITTHENIHHFIEISNKSDELSISLRDGNYKNTNITVVASSAQYYNIEAEGASTVNVEGGASFENYEIDLSGASRFSGALDIVSILEVDASGASKIDITGSAQGCNADLSGSSELLSTAFSCESLDVDLSGASNVEMSVSDYISGDLSGASSIKYKGSPKVNVDLSGSSKVEAIK